MVPGGKPVIAVPGLTPTSPPSMTDEPVLVTVEPARTEKFPAVAKKTSALVSREKPASAVIASRARTVRLIIGTPLCIQTYIFAVRLCYGGHSIKATNRAAGFQPRIS